MAIDYQKLKTELDAPHPVTGTYNANNQFAADQINVKNRTRNRTTATGRQVANEVVDPEYDALTDPQKSQFLSLVASEDLDPFGLAANVVKDIFGVGSTTVSNLQTFRVESISRATELDFPAIEEKDIRAARNLP